MPSERLHGCGPATSEPPADGVKAPSVREDWLERLVLRFFEQRIFGPMRLAKLAKQPGADQREQGELAGTKIRQQVIEHPFSRTSLFSPSGLRLALVLMCTLSCSHLRPH